jgi:hypothetical protein
MLSPQPQQFAQPVEPPPMRIGDDGYGHIAQCQLDADSAPHAVSVRQPQLSPWQGRRVRSHTPWNCLPDRRQRISDANWMLSVRSYAGSSPPQQALTAAGVVHGEQGGEGGCATF